MAEANFQSIHTTHNMAFLQNFFKSLFGDKKSRDIKAIRPVVEKVLQVSPEIQKLDNDELRQKTLDIKRYLQDLVADKRKEIEQINATIQQTDIDHRKPLFDKIDALNKEVLEIFEEGLNEVLPEVFAVIKETAKRFATAENGVVEVTATDFDRQLAETLPADNQYVTIEGDKAFWHNHWVAGGNDTIWNMIHYDVQLFGGVVLHQGKIAEMATGEGKTLVATLPVFLNALTGNGVHVVTVNDYLAKRDSEWMGPLYQFHGLSVDCIDKHRPNSDERRKAYLADITFGTNNEFGFDYLRDNMAMRPADLVQRMHNYAIVDEVDSVLIDDARTPLIISGPVPRGEEQMFEEYQPIVEKLYEAQRKLATQYLAEAKRLIESDNQNDIDNGFLSLFRSYKALPKNNPLIKYLSEPGIKAGMLKTEEIYMANNNRRMPEATDPLFFVIDEKQKGVDMTDKGNKLLADIVGDDKLFVLPDIAAEISDLENQGLSDEEKAHKKDELMEHYALQSERVHTIQQLLKAYTLFTNNVDYIVTEDSEVKIVDESTGRIMEGRRWSDGLHQAVEAKEHVKVQAATQTFATITLQNYFRMYHKLAGMTGTAITEAGELWDIYKLDVVEIPTNKPVIRDDQNDQVYKTMRAKYKAVIEEIVSLSDAGRSVLVGTTSVEISEMLARMLMMRKIKCNVLNAKLHQKEADIVAEAGHIVDAQGKVVDENWKVLDHNGHVVDQKNWYTPEQLNGKEPNSKNLQDLFRKLSAQWRICDEEGRTVDKYYLDSHNYHPTITIATNMAGRGTDIKLSSAVWAKGGLAIVGTERHESRRVDRQLRGRSGRQGDPGSSCFFVSLEDPLMRMFASQRIVNVMDKLGFKEDEVIEHPWINKSIERAQKKVEENNFGIRKHLLEYDDVMNRQRTFVYERRRHALMGERIGMDISNMIWDRCVNIIENNGYEDARDLFITVFAIQIPFSKEDYDNKDRNELEDLAFDAVMQSFKRKTDKFREMAWPVIKGVYEEKGDMYENILVPITDGRRMYQISVPLKEAYETEAKSVVWSFEKVLLLHHIDDEWKENLRRLDDLKVAVRNSASIEQKDPLVIFKLESVKLFDEMVDNINNSTTKVLTRMQLPVGGPDEAQRQPQQASRPAPRMTETHQETTSSLGGERARAQQQAASQDTRAQQQRPDGRPMRSPIVNNMPKVGRNDPCPCGSGKKYKNCHGKGQV